MREATRMPDSTLIAAEIVEELARIGAFAASRHWVPATAGNFSRRIDARTFAITRSGVDKGAIATDDVVAVSLDAPFPAGVSAETPLHGARYASDANVGAVVHVHTVAATVLSRAHERDGALTLDGFEMHKALAGISTHASQVRIPIFSNDQDTLALAERIESALGEAPLPAYLLAGHGLYVWGTTMSQARRHLEGIEFLLACALEERRMA